jgi:transmembrane sensor
MDHLEQKRQERLALITEAAQWLARSKTEDEQVRLEFFRWLTHSPEHMRAFLLAYRTDFELREYFRERSVDVTTSPGNNVVELRPAESAAAQKRRWLPPWKWVAAASIAAALLLAALATPVLQETRLNPNVHATSADEQWTVELADGSSILLNADSRVRVSYHELRDVYLLDGQAVFSVARDATRPFRVHVDSSIVQAAGTKFDVQRRAQRFEVAVIEGAVQVTPGTGGAQAGRLANPTQVVAGQGVSVAANGVTTAPAPIDVAQVSEWQRLDFRDTPLAEVAKKFAQRNAKPQLRIEGATLQARRVNGVFDEPEDVLAHLADDQTLAIVRNGKEVVIRMRNDFAN